MDFLIMVIAFYLAVGLFITYAALKDDQFTESIFELGFFIKDFRYDCMHIGSSNYFNQRVYE
jgi:hypothetical protein